MLETLSEFLLLTLMVVGGLRLSWQLSFGIFVLQYFYSCHFFASVASNVLAMFTCFFSTTSALGSPLLFREIILPFLSYFFRCHMHYDIMLVRVLLAQLCSFGFMVRLWLCRHFSECVYLPWKLELDSSIGKH